MNILTSVFGKNNTVTINGKDYVGGSLTISGNGNVVTVGNHQINVTNDKVINIAIKGDIQTLETAIGSVDVYGNANNVSTVSGDIEIAGNVGDNVKTVSGDVKVQGSVSGSIKTVSGGIKHGY